MTTMTSRMLLSALLPLALGACGKSEKKAADMAGMGMSKEAGKPADKDAVTLSAQQIADAGIETARPMVGGIAGSATPSSVGMCSPSSKAARRHR